MNKKLMLLTSSIMSSIICCDVLMLGCAPLADNRGFNANEGINDDSRLADQSFAVGTDIAQQNHEITDAIAAQTIRAELAGDTQNVSGLQEGISKANNLLQKLIKHKHKRPTIHYFENIEELINDTNTQAIILTEEELNTYNNSLERMLSLEDQYAEYMVKSRECKEKQEKLEKIGNKLKEQVNNKQISNALVQEAQKLAEQTRKNRVVSAQTHQALRICMFQIHCNALETLQSINKKLLSRAQEQYTTSEETKALNNVIQGIDINNANAQTLIDNTKKEIEGLQRKMEQKPQERESKSKLINHNAEIIEEIQQHQHELTKGLLQTIKDAQNSQKPSLQIIEDGLQHVRANIEKVIGYNNTISSLHDDQVIEEQKAIKKQMYATLQTAELQALQTRYSVLEARSQAIMADAEKYTDLSNAIQTLQTMLDTTREQIAQGQVNQETVEALSQGLQSIQEQNDTLMDAVRKALELEKLMAQHTRLTVQYNELAAQSQTVMSDAVAYEDNFNISHYIRNLENMLEDIQTQIAQGQLNEDAIAILSQGISDIQEQQDTLRNAVKEARILELEQKQMLLKELSNKRVNDYKPTEKPEIMQQKLFQMVQTTKSQINLLREDIIAKKLMVQHTRLTAQYNELAAQSQAIITDAEKYPDLLNEVQTLQTMLDTTREQIAQGQLNEDAIAILSQGISDIREQKDALRDAVRAARMLELEQKEQILEELKQKKKIAQNKKQSIEQELHRAKKDKELITKEITKKKQHIELIHIQEENEQLIAQLGKTYHNILQTIPYGPNNTIFQNVLDKLHNMMKSIEHENTTISDLLNQTTNDPITSEELLDINDKHNKFVQQFDDMNTSVLESYNNQFELLAQQSQAIITDAKKYPDLSNAIQILQTMLDAAQDQVSQETIDVLSQGLQSIQAQQDTLRNAVRAARMLELGQKRNTRAELMQHRKANDHELQKIQEDIQTRLVQRMQIIREREQKIRERKNLLQEDIIAKKLRKQYNKLIERYEELAPQSQAVMADAVAYKDNHDISLRIQNLGDILNDAQIQIAQDQVNQETIEALSQTILNIRQQKNALKRAVKKVRTLEIWQKRKTLRTLMHKRNRNIQLQVVLNNVERNIEQDLTEAIREQANSLRADMRTIKLRAQYENLETRYSVLEARSQAIITDAEKYPDLSNEIQTLQTTLDTTREQIAQGQLNEDAIGIISQGILSIQQQNDTLMDAVRKALELEKLRTQHTRLTEQYSALEAQSQAIITDAKKYPDLLNVAQMLQVKLHTAQEQIAQDQVSQETIDVLSQGLQSIQAQQDTLRNAVKEARMLKLEQKQMLLKELSNKRVNDYKPTEKPEIMQARLVQKTKIIREQTNLLRQDTRSKKLRAQHKRLTAQYNELTAQYNELAAQSQTVIADVEEDLKYNPDLSNMVQMLQAKLHATQEQIEQGVTNEEGINKISALIESIHSQYEEFVTSASNAKARQIELNEKFSALKHTNAQISDRSIMLQKRLDDIKERLNDKKNHLQQAKHALHDRNEQLQTIHTKLQQKIQQIQEEQLEKDKQNREAMQQMDALYMQSAVNKDQSFRLNNIEECIIQSAESVQDAIEFDYQSVLSGLIIQTAHRRTNDYGITTSISSRRHRGMMTPVSYKHNNRTKNNISNRSKNVSNKRKLQHRTRRILSHLQNQYRVLASLSMKGLRGMRCGTATRPC